MFDPNFCSESNISSCFQILISELELLNIPIVEYQDGNNSLTVYLLNVTWSFVTNRKRQVVKINEQNEIILNLKAKLNSLEDINIKNLSLIESNERQNLHLKEQITELSSEKDKYISQIRDAKKDIKCLHGTLAKQQLQFEHDIRRKNNIIEDLKVKVLKLLGPNQKVHEKPDLSRFSPGVPIIEEKKLARKCLSNLQNNIQLLLMENVNLRNSLLKVYVSCLESNINRDDHLILEKKERLLKLPYQELVNEIEHDIISHINSTKCHFDKTKSVQN